MIFETLMKSNYLGLLHIPAASPLSSPGTACRGSMSCSADLYLFLSDLSHLAGDMEATIPSGAEYPKRSCDG